MGIGPIPRFPLVPMILFSQVINGVLLPFVLIYSDPADQSGAA